MMKTTLRPLDYYRRILSGQSHAFKQLEPLAKIVRCNRAQELHCDPGPSWQWYYVIVGAVRRRWVRRDAGRKIVDLMLPQDFFFASDGQTDEPVEAIAEETVLASYPGPRV